MKRSHSKFIVVMIVIGMILTSGSSVFAATPNEQVIAAIQGSSLPSTYTEITKSFLRDTGKVLTQAQADSIIGNISTADGIFKATSGKGTAEQAWAIEKQFEAACTTAGFVVSNVSRTSDGGFKFTVTDPASGKSVTAQGNATRIVWSSEGVASSGTTMVAKTGLDNSLFSVAAILAMLTVAASVFVIRKKVIQ